MNGVEPPYQAPPAEPCPYCGEFIHYAEHHRCPSEPIAQGEGTAIGSTLPASVGFFFRFSAAARAAAKRAKAPRPEVG